MIPAIIMYTYYGKVVGDVAALAAGVSPPRGPEYYALLAVGLIAIIVVDDDDHAGGAARDGAAAATFVNHERRPIALRTSVWAAQKYCVESFESGACFVISGACEAVFDRENLVEPALMTLFAREFGGKKDSNQVAGKCRPYDARTETQDVHVVVLHRLPGGVAVVAHGRAHAGKLVRSNRHAGTAAAYDEAAVYTPIAKRGRDRFSAIGIVDGSRRVGSEIEHVVPLRPQHGRKIALHLEAGVVRGKRDTHRAAILARLL